MATIRAYIRTTKKKADEVNIRFRLSDGRKVQLHHVSEILVNPDKWDDVRQEIKKRALVPDDYRNEINSGVSSRKELLLDVYGLIKDDPDPERWYAEIEKCLNPEKHKPKVKTFFDYFDDYITIETDSLKPHLRVLKRCLQRWEMYEQTKNQSFKLDLTKLNDRDVQRFDKFLQIEHSLQYKYPKIYKTIKSRTVVPRGINSRSNILGRFRAYYKWIVKKGHTTNNPFTEFKVPQERYGTPYYITIEERNKLLSTDLSEHPQTAIQRDIFVFQCLIGCRVSDLTSLTKSNVKDNGNFIEYIAKKTKKKEPVTVRVPLIDTAKELIKKYSGGEKLFPFISDPKYNEHIKNAFTYAGLNRLVTVLNPTTGEEEQRPLNEVASSHLARRAFIGNLYKKVKDPNLVASMSGHVEGSRAFARYRAIDDGIKQETIKYLE
jgi:site-specific recombinase XerD